MPDEPSWPTADEPAPRPDDEDPGRRRPLLFVVGALVGILLVAAVGVSLGTAFTEQDRTAIADVPTPVSTADQAEQVVALVAALPEDAARKLAAIAPEVAGSPLPGDVLDTYAATVTAAREQGRVLPPPPSLHLSYRLHEDEARAADRDDRALYGLQGYLALVQDLEEVTTTAWFCFTDAATRTCPSLVEAQTALTTWATDAEQGEVVRGPTIDDRVPDAWDDTALTVLVERAREAGVELPAAFVDLQRRIRSGADRGTAAPAEFDRDPLAVNDLVISTLDATGAAPDGSLGLAELVAAHVDVVWTAADCHDDDVTLADCAPLEHHRWYAQVLADRTVADTAD